MRSFYLCLVDNEVLFAELAAMRERNTGTVYSYSSMWTHAHVPAAATSRMTAAGGCHGCCVASPPALELAGTAGTGGEGAH